MVSDEMVARVLAFATDAHWLRAQKPENRFRKNTNPVRLYITHPIEVAQIAFDSVPQWDVDSRKLLMMVGYLHDVIEDTTVTLAELDAFLFGVGLSVNNASIVSNAVKRLTKNKDEDILVYLSRVYETEFSRRVKLADLKHNSSDLKPGNLLDKYKLAVYYLGKF